MQGLQIQIHCYSEFRQRQRRTVAVRSAQGTPSFGLPGDYEWIEVTKVQYRVRLLRSEISKLLKHSISTNKAPECSQTKHLSTFCIFSEP